LQRQIPFIKAAIAIRPDLKLWGVPWSPPSWMKSNNSLVGGWIKTDSQTMNALALYFEKYVQAYKGQGINLYMVMPQNEPGYETGYSSCRYDGNILRDFIKNYLGPKFAQDNINCQIWLGSLPNSDMTYVNPSMIDSAAKAYIQGAGFQWEGANAAHQVYNAYSDVRLMQTETKCGNHENNWSYAEEQFDLMRSYFDSGVNSYMLWNMVLDETGLSTAAWAQCSPIVVNKSSKIVTYNPQFYMFKHFSSYVKPGACSIDSVGNYGDCVAYMNPNGENVLVVENKTANALAVAINFNGQKIKPTLPAHSFNTFRTTAGSYPPIYKNAYYTFEAENFDSQSGIQTEACGEGGFNVGFIEDGDYVCFNDIDFEGASAASVNARVATANAGGNIEFRLDSPTGTLIGTCPVSSTGGWQNWATRSVNLSGASGVHDVYLKFTGGTGYLFNVNSFKFNTSAVMPSNGSTYHLICKNSGKALDNSGSTADGGRVNQWGDQSVNSNQEWKLVDVGSGYFNLVCQKSGKALDNSGSTSDGTIMKQWTVMSGNQNQHWRFASVGGGYYNVICRVGGKTLDNGGSSTDGTAVKQWSVNSGNANQQWLLKFVR
jgi:glucosylceramidase